MAKNDLPGSPLDTDPNCSITTLRPSSLGDIALSRSGSELYLVDTPDTQNAVSIFVPFNIPTTILNDGFLSLGKNYGFKFEYRSTDTLVVSRSIRPNFKQIFAT